MNIPVHRPINYHINTRCKVSHADTSEGEGFASVGEGVTLGKENGLAGNVGGVAEKEGEVN